MRRKHFFALAAVGIVGATALWFSVPGQSRWLPPCVFHLLTGLHCPGCGTTRALHALVHGEIWIAVRMNPLLIIGGPVIASLVVYSRRHERRSGRATAGITWSICAVVIAYFILRNVPTPSTSPLAPLPVRWDPPAASAPPVPKGSLGDLIHPIGFAVGQIGFGNNAETLAPERLGG